MKRTFKRSYAVLSDLFRFLDGFLDEHDIDERAAFAARLALEEVFTNMVKYSTSSADHVSVQITGGADGLVLVLVLEDTGAEPFDPTIHPEPDLQAPLAQRRAGGLGLHLVRNLVDSIEHEYVDGANVITLRIQAAEKEHRP